MKLLIRFLVLLAVLVPGMSQTQTGQEPAKNHRTNNG